MFLIRKTFAVAAMLFATTTTAYKLDAPDVNAPMMFEEENDVELGLFFAQLADDLAIDMGKKTPKVKGSECQVNINADLTHRFDKSSKKYNFKYEMYDTSTEDGYNIALVRVMKKGEKRGTKVNRPPLLMVHGVQQSSEIYLTEGKDGSGPTKPLAV